MAIDMTRPTTASSTSAGSAPMALAAMGRPSMLTGRLTVTVSTTVSQNGGRRSSAVVRACTAQRRRSPAPSRVVKRSSGGRP